MPAAPTHPEALVPDQLVTELCNHGFSALEATSIIREGGPEAAAELLGVTLEALEAKISAELEEADRICAATFVVGSSQVLGACKIADWKHEQFTPDWRLAFVNRLRAIEPGSSAQRSVAIETLIEFAMTGSDDQLLCLHTGARRLVLAEETEAEDYLIAAESLISDTLRGVDLANAIRELTDRGTLWLDLMTLDEEEGEAELLHMLREHALRETDPSRQLACATLMQAIEQHRQADVVCALLELDYSLWELEFTQLWLERAVSDGLIPRQNG